MSQQHEESDIPIVEINNDTLDDDAENDTEQNARTLRPPPNKRMQSFPTAQRQFRGLVDAVMVGNDAEFTLTQDEQSQLDTILHETSKSAFAIGCIEVYVFKNPRLVPVGFWMDSSVLENASLTENEVELLMDPQVAYPNNDLVGLLWSTEVLPGERVGNDVTLTRKRFSSGTQESVDPTVTMSSITTVSQQNLGRPHNVQLPHNVGTAAAAAIKRRRHKGSQQTALHWTELSSVIQDPDQSHGMRTEVMYKAGLVKATGIPFNVARLEGMVVYYGTAGAHSNLTTAQDHETYLKRMTHVKGAVLAAIQAGRESLALLQSESHVPGNETNETMLSDETIIGPQSSSLARRRRCRKCVAAWFRKIKGSAAQIPPGISWSETAWTFVGSFIGMLTMYAMNEGFRIVTEGEYFLIGGPFGALAMLQYGMIGAPASQPRSIFFGNLITGTIALALTYLPGNLLPLALRQLLTCSIAISVMMKLGVPCPPAAAFGLIYARGNHSWRFFGFTLICILVSFIPAMAINNLNPRRQYPTFWGYSPSRLARMVREGLCFCKDKERSSHAK